MRRLQFADFWLWLARVLLLAFFVLLISKLVLIEQHKTNYYNLPNQVITDNKLLEISNVKTKVDSFRRTGSEIHYLNMPTAKTEDFTKGKTPQVIDKTSIWAMLHSFELQELKPDTVFVFAYPKLAHFLGETPRYSYTLIWPNLPGEADHIYLADAEIRQKKIIFTLGKSHEKRTTFEKYSFPFSGQSTFDLASLPSITLEGTKPVLAYLEKQKALAIPVRTAQKLDVVLYSTRHQLESKKHFLAALQSIQQYLGKEINIKQYDSKQFQLSQVEKADWVIWLSKQNWQDKAQKTTNKWLVNQSNAYNEWPIKLQQDSTMEYHTVDLNLKEAVHQTTKRLPAALLHLFYEGTIDKKLLLENDMRRLPISSLMEEKKKEKTNAVFTEIEEKQKSMHLELWFLILLLFIVERFIANHKN